VKQQALGSYFPATDPLILFFTFFLLFLCAQGAASGFGKLFASHRLCHAPQCKEPYVFIFIFS
jgi:hypothetical protein